MEEKDKEQLREILEWYAETRGVTIGELDDFDAHICRVIQKYVNEKMSSSK